MPLGYNTVLGDPKLAPENRSHRVAICGWPCSIEDPRTATLDALLGHLAAAGYEGVEFFINTFERYFPDESQPTVARKARNALDKFGLRLFGSTLHIPDENMRALNWIDKYIDEMKIIQDMGGEYASYQISVHPDHGETGGAYRQDERYLQWCAQRVVELRSAAWDLGLNFYNEVHVGRITEDPGACARLLELATCELNGDMSHFIARGFMHGPYVEKVLDYMGHTHVRMARQYGDLSAGVDDPAADWDAAGVTWQMFAFMKRGLHGGLSSRTIAGETGPMHLVTDTLTQDAALVPLYRAMARYADASAQGIELKVDSPADLRPWG